MYCFHCFPHKMHSRQGNPLGPQGPETLSSYHPEEGCDVGRACPLGRMLVGGQQAIPKVTPSPGDPESLPSGTK